MEQSNQIQLLLRDGPVSKAFIVDVSATDTIASIKTKLAQQCGISNELMKIVFCGRNLTVLITKVAKPSRVVDESWELVEQVNVKSLREAESNESHSSFHVYCKNCKKMRRGKLRAYCAKCDSSTIMFVNQPNDWPDLGYKTHGAPETYCEQVHNQQNLVRKASIGFTVACPDVFRMCIIFIYSEKKAMSVTKNCGAAFTLEDADDEQEKMILCPECSKLYCRFCQSLGACRCNDQSNDENLKTIKRISKPCPSCGAPTERDGGCAHVRPSGATFAVACGRIIVNGFVK
ncbi:IBR domain containing protein [Ditylenchus destructor]|nr:IBR domain containing protein [Ditylenchus destructor]